MATFNVTRGKGEVDSEQFRVAQLLNRRTPRAEVCLAKPEKGPIEMPVKEDEDKDVLSLRIR